jgi:hypothetical protein
MAIAIYHTHCNGDCPYEVSITGTDVTVKRRDKNTYGVNATYRGDPILEIKNYIKKYIGDDNGNTVLIETEPKHFTYIGDSIYNFVTIDDIIAYISPTGNSDVPYPYAIGTTNTYLMLEQSFIPNNLVVSNDPYNQFYERHPSIKVYDILKQNNYQIRKNTRMTNFYKQKFAINCNVVSMYEYREFNK